jgi:hypothetical protein
VKTVLDIGACVRHTRIKKQSGRGLSR